MKKLTTLATLISAFALNSAYANQIKTFTYCVESSPMFLNPQMATDGASFDVGQAVFDRLIGFEKGTTNIIPSLAEKWQVSDDGKTYLLTLRKNVKFHSNKDFKPTRDFNADDVVFSYTRFIDENNPYHKVSGGSYELFTGVDMQNIIDTVEKVDDYIVKFTLKVPNAPFLSNLALDYGAILSAEYADKMLKAGTPEKVDSNPIGTGPYSFYSYQKDANVRFMAFPQYWQGKSKIDRLVFTVTPDATVRTAKLQKNECQAIPYPNPADLPTLKADPNINVLENPGLNIGYITLNARQKPLDNVLVRKALNYAVNKDAVLESVYQGAGLKAKNPIPPSVWGYNDDVVDFEYNPEKAKELLKEAGFENGFETELWAMPVSRPYNPNARRMAEMIQHDWAQIGVQAKIVSYEWGEYLKRMAKGEHATGMMGWTGDNGDPDNFFTPLLTCNAVELGSNYAGFCDKEFDEAINKASQINDKAEREQIYKNAQVKMKELAVWLPIAHSTVFFPIRKEVKGYVPSPFMAHNFYGIDVE
ncbi:peptide transporter [Pasteurellaceae bacterium LFhippo2]|nr:peptide transporter [Pasteurellaceae bacterium LFhippo2]